MRIIAEGTLENLARAHFGSLGANFLCSIKLPLMSEQEVLKRVVVEGSEHPQSIAAQGKPILYAITHMSC